MTPAEIAEDGRRSFAERIKRIFHRPPDFVIGNDYLRRWWVIPRNRWFNIYLHNIRHDDEDRALHDHPWWNCSIVLRGGYREVMPPIIHPQAPQREKVRTAGSIVFRRAEDAHRLIVGDGEAWTIFITGPRIREWGFWCPKGWVKWTDFVDGADHGKIGRGCGEHDERLPGETAAEFVRRVYLGSSLLAGEGRGE